MKFDWDGEKSDKNKIKHGIDFKTAKGIWSDKKRIEIHAPYPLEERNIIIGKLYNKSWTAIYTIHTW